MARRKHLDEPEQLLLNIPTSVLTRVRMSLLDPFTQKVRYGALSSLTTQLYQRWLTEQQALHQNRQLTPPPPAKSEA